MDRHCLKSPTLWIAALHLGMSAATAQIPPPARRVSWSPGIPGGIPHIAGPVQSVVDHGAAADGSTDDHGAFTAAIDALPADGGVVHIPAGTYLLRNTIAIDKAVVLRGEGAERTVLRFDHGGAARNCIQVVTYGRGSWVNILSGYEKGSSRVVVADPSPFHAGAIVETQQENDASVMYTRADWDQSWAAGAVGQLNVCSAVVGDTVVLERPLYIAYDGELHPQIRTNRLVDGAGIEYLRLVKTEPSDGSTIQLKNVDRCWVLGVLSDTTAKSHITMNTAFRCEIRQSCFRYSYDYGGGGHGYGVEMGFHTTDCLAEDNVFVHLRHSMMVHVGASGNVFGYNYSREPFSGESWTPCDISLHGHYANYNLFEGNVVQEIDHADYWGPVGPGNTILRCKVEAEGIDVSDQSHYQNLIGNVLGTGANTINIADGVDSTLVHGNRVKGALQWDPAVSDRELPASLYLEQKPQWFGATPWPLYGPDAATDNKPPSQVRYESGNCVSSVSPGNGVSPARSAGRGAMPVHGKVFDLRGAAADIHWGHAADGVYIVYRRGEPAPRLHWMR